VPAMRSGVSNVPSAICWRNAWIFARRRLDVSGRSASIRPSRENSTGSVSPSSPSEFRKPTCDGAPLEARIVTAYELVIPILLISLMVRHVLWPTGGRSARRPLSTKVRATSAPTGLARASTRGSPLTRPHDRIHP